MAQAFQRHPSSSLFATDGKPHPLQDTLMAVTLALGVLAFVTAQFHSLHLVASWAGLIGFLIIGLGAAAVGFFLGMARGGLFGGVIG
jgi:protein-S-isoprenylcysteine O-methyltransferase Ste14